MHPRTTAARRRAGAPFLCALAVALAGCSPERYPQTALLPLSDFARIGDHVQDQTFYWALGVFILVEGALLYSIFRFRGRPEDPEPSQIHGNTTIEIIWTLIPALILAAIAVPTVKGIFETNTIPKGAMVIEVIGHQWWWEFRYPGANITTANEMFIPAGRTVELKINSGDVVHSFWPPRFSGKRDVFPGRETRLWWKADSTGLYPGQCAAYAAGEKLFMTKGCMGCHSLQAVGAPKGLIGPNLANVGARSHIAAGWLPNTDENLERWIREPQSVKKGVLMPNLGVTVEEARALRAYLRAHQ